MERNSIDGARAERIIVTGPKQRRIEPEEFAAALGAEPCDARLPAGADLLSLAELGNGLLKRLRSGGENPDLPDVSRPCQVPLSEQDVADLGAIVTALERATGARPSLGQIASVIVRMHLDALKQTVRE